MKRVPSRRERQKTQRRLSLEVAALELFSEKGVAGTTVEEITERADVGKGTFFNYYESKQDVLVQRFRTIARKFLDIIDDCAEEDPLPALVRFFHGVERLFDPEAVSIRTLYREVLTNPHLMFEDLDAEQRVLTFYSALLTGGQSKGSIRSDLRTDLAARVILDLWASTLRQWILGAVPGLGNAMEEKLNLLFEGLTAGRDRSPAD
jgi:AcrR family transcriptional regulator